MRRGIGRLRAGGSGFNPANFFGSRLLIWIDRSDSALAWQDSGRTTPAVVGQPIGSRQNKGTLSLFMQQTVSGSRAVLTSDATGLYDAYDGLDDGSLSSASADLSSFNKITVCIGVRKEFDGAAAIASELTVNTSTTNGGFYVGAPDRAAAIYGFALRGTASVASGTIGTYTSPVASVITCAYDTSAGTVATQIAPRVNGSSVAITPDGAVTSAGNLANATYYEGRRNNATLPFTGRIYQTLVISGTLTAGELTLVERFVGSKMGIAL
jgi:hypothetical protein